MVKKNLILALEPGLDGGTLSILESGRQIDFAMGTKSVSRSEDLLILLEGLLKRKGLSKRQIERIVVSGSPGSLTGIRIGSALAKGLGDALRIEVKIVSLLEAIAETANLKGELLIALATKTSGIFFRPYTFSGKHLKPVGEVFNEGEISRILQFLENNRTKKFRVVINEEMERELKDQQITSHILKEKMIKTVSGNPAEILGQWMAKCVR